MTENKKYELTDETITFSGLTLHRIRALKDFGNVIKGDLGGFIESEKNLSHSGTCWVYDDAMVYRNARVIENAKIMQNAEIYNKAIVSKNALVNNDARVFERAIITDFASVSGHAMVCGKAIIKGSANLSNRVLIYGKAVVSKCSVLAVDALISGNAEIAVDTYVPCLKSKAVIKGNALISSQNDILVISPVGPRGGILTAYRSKLGNIEVNTQLFKGTINEFTQIVLIKYHNEDLFLEQYLSAIAFIKQFFKISDKRR